MENRENLEITEQDEILTGEELNEAAVEAEAEGAEESGIDPEAADADPGTDPEEAAGEEEEAEAEEADAIAQLIEEIGASLVALTERLDAIGSRLDAIEAREAKRSKKLTGFFAPVGGDDKSSADAGELPRIEKRYL